jgi:hypothetical protein
MAMKNHEPPPLHHKHRGLLWLAVLAVLVEQLCFTAPYAEDISASGSHATASAHLNFKIVIPEQLRLQVEQQSDNHSITGINVRMDVRDRYAVHKTLPGTALSQSNTMPPFSNSPYPNLMECRSGTTRKPAYCLLALP